MQNFASESWEVTIQSIKFADEKLRKVNQEMLLTSK